MQDRSTWPRRRCAASLSLLRLEDRITPQAAMTPSQAIRAYGFDLVQKVNGTTLDGAGQTIALHYRLRAKYPIRTRTFQSRVYEYYEPEVKSVAQPVEMEIRKR